MKYGDFSSIVQLGVGLHLGTALLQLYGDFALQPLVRKMSRLDTLVRNSRRKPRTADLRTLQKIESDYNIFKIRLFKRYRWFVIANSGVAVLLTGILVFISFCASCELAAEIGVLLVAFSVLPAPITLFTLWVDASNDVRKIEREANDLQAHLVGFK